MCETLKPSCEGESQWVFLLPSRASTASSRTFHRHRSSRGMEEKWEKKVFIVFNIFPISSSSSTLNYNDYDVISHFLRCHTTAEPASPSSSGRAQGENCFMLSMSIGGGWVGGMAEIIMRGRSKISSISSCECFKHFPHRHYYCSSCVSSFLYTSRSPPPPLHSVINYMLKSVQWRPKSEIRWRWYMCDIFRSKVINNNNSMTFTCLLARFSFTFLFVSLVKFSTRSHFPLTTTARPLAHFISAWEICFYSKKLKGSWYVWASARECVSFCCFFTFHFNI